MLRKKTYFETYTTGFGKLNLPIPAKKEKKKIKKN
jgi:hypothetical protein